jgi:TolB protein
LSKLTTGDRGRRTLLAFIGLVLCSGLALGQDDGETGLSREEQIEIWKNKIVPKIPLLLEEFAKGRGAAEQDTRLVYEVLANDLEYADFFEITRVPLMGPDETLTGVTGQALVRGTVKVEGGDLVLEGVLESFPARSRIFSREYRTRPEWYREAAHRFADDIVHYLTGGPGIARTKIAFASNRTGNKEIYIVDYDGHGLRQVTHNGSINLSPAWSPDGRKLAYVSYTKGNPDVFVIDLATGKEDLVVGGVGVQSAPSFSPDGKSLLFNHTKGRESEIYACNLDGRKRRRVTRMGGINTSPCWSPDGRRIVFTSDRSGNPQLYVTDAEGGRPRRLTYEGKWNDIPDWSVDGRRIVYSSMRSGNFRIGLIEPSGLGDERPLTLGPGSDEHPSWAPDGRHVVFVSTRGGAHGLHVMDVEQPHRIRTVLAGEGRCYGAAWSPVPSR